MSAESQILLKQNQNINTKQATDFAISYHGKVINFIAFVDPIHVNNKDEKKQNAPLLEFNTYMESFDCLPFTQL